jgi:hypothetical protein
LWTYGAPFDFKTRKGHPDTIVIKAIRKFSTIQK